MPHLEDESLYARASDKVILEKTRSIVDKEVERSKVFDATLEDSIPQFEINELSLGRVVGRGGFCVAREITSIKLKVEEDVSNRKVGGLSLLRKASHSMAHSEGESTREYLARRLWSKAGKYVIKQVDSELFYSDRVTFLKGMIDIALETKYLASLEHPHLLKIRGVSKTSPSNAFGTFVILDQLTETLGKRLNSWMQRKRATKGITGALTGGKGKVNKLYTERLLAVYDIAEAMYYLHGRKIIYRDLVSQCYVLRLAYSFIFIVDFSHTCHLSAMITFSIYESVETRQHWIRCARHLKNL
jgi:serine/threonine protein kinase